MTATVGKVVTEIGLLVALTGILFSVYAGGYGFAAIFLVGAPFLLYARAHFDSSSESRGGS